jgi:hypothetical protein
MRRQSRERFVTVNVCVCGPIIGKGLSPVMLTVRRYAVIQSLLIWQGGFLFYAAIVVPAGTEVLGSAVAQGAITARVTDTMNALGAIALIVLALDLRLTADQNSQRTAIRWWCWSIAFLCQGLLFYFHLLLDAFMDPTRSRVVIGPPFRPVHRMYLWTISLQWFVCLFLVWFNIQAWGAEERTTSKPPQ